MNLNTIKTQLENNYYSFSDDCTNDISTVTSTSNSIHPQDGKTEKKSDPKIEPKNKALKGCIDALQELFSKKHEVYAWPFYRSKNLAWLGLNEGIIKTPMDLDTVKTKLKFRQYKNTKDFIYDISLMFSNCYECFYKHTNIILMAKKLQVVFEAKMSKVPSGSLLMEPDDVSSSEESSGSSLSDSDDLETLNKAEEILKQSNILQEEIRKFVEKINRKKDEKNKTQQSNKWKRCRDDSEVDTKKKRKTESVDQKQQHTDEFNQLPVSTLRELQTSCQKKPYKIPIKEHPELTKRIQKQYDILFGKSPTVIRTSGTKNARPTKKSDRLSTFTSSESDSNFSISSSSSCSDSDSSS